MDRYLERCAAIATMALWTCAPSNTGVVEVPVGLKPSARCFA